MLCATIKSESYQDLELANEYADLIEIRLDLFQPQDLPRFRAACQKPVIFAMQEPDFKALALLPNYVDLPHLNSAQTFEKMKQAFPTIQRICSYHDYEKTGDLTVIYSQLKTRPAEVYKIACLANATTDALRMLQFVKKSGCLGISMGELGVITRILAPVYNAPWTYAPLVDKQKTAPGQLLLSELKGVYHCERLSVKTDVYGLIGDPVDKSMSHQTHNFAFRKLGLDAVYVKMRVCEKELATFFCLSKELGFKGLSVTMPLKEAVIPYLDEYDARAINTIGFKEKTYGWNTDGIGALDALEKKQKVHGKQVVILGAGGAAVGIAKEAKKRGAHVCIVNRTFKRAQALAEVVGAEAVPLSEFEAVSRKGYAILINCTSVGMGSDARLPIPEEHLLEKRVVMDIVANPRETPLLKAAKKKKCQLVEGMDMWTEQAIGQYSYWFEEHFV